MYILLYLYFYFTCTLTWYLFLYLSVCMYSPLNLFGYWTLNKHYYYYYTMFAVNSRSLFHSAEWLYLRTYIVLQLQKHPYNHIYARERERERERCHCLCLRETHRSRNLSRPKIAVMTLAAERPHKYGSDILFPKKLGWITFMEEYKELLN